MLKLDKSEEIWCCHFADLTHGDLYFYIIQKLYYPWGQKSLHPLHQPTGIFHTPIFHTPPLASISRLLSSRTFWSIDSSPWRLSSSCQATQTHGGLLAVKGSAKLHILSHHSIFMAWISNWSIQTFFFPMRPRTNQKTLQSNKEQLNQRWFKEFHCAVTGRITKRQRDRKRENTTD